MSNKFCIKKQLLITSSALATTIGFGLTAICPARAQKIWNPRMIMTCSQGSYAFRTYRQGESRRGGELYINGRTYPLTYETKANRGFWNETTGTGYVINIGGNNDDNFRLYKGSNVIYSGCQWK